jgi:plastocyanin
MLPPSNSGVVQPLQSPNAILYSDSGFAPNPLRVPVGTVVTFVNNSSNKMWPASAVHPTHNEYPTTGGCIGSTFDACRGIEPGETWEFKFDIKGTWQYHDHLSPKSYGTIIVE